MGLHLFRYVQKGVFHSRFSLYWQHSKHLERLAEKKIEACRFCFFKKNGQGGKVTPPLHFNISALPNRPIRFRKLSQKTGTENRTKIIDQPTGYLFSIFSKFPFFQKSTHNHHLINALQPTSRFFSLRSPSVPSFPFDSNLHFLLSSSGTGTICATYSTTHSYPNTCTRQKRQHFLSRHSISLFLPPFFLFPQSALLSHLPFPHLPDNPLSLLISNGTFSALPSIIRCLPMNHPSDFNTSSLSWQSNILCPQTGHPFPLSPHFLSEATHHLPKFPSFFFLPIPKMLLRIQKNHPKGIVFSLLRQKTLRKIKKIRGRNLQKRHRFSLITIFYRNFAPN